MIFGYFNGPQREEQLVSKWAKPELNREDSDFFRFWRLTATGKGGESV